MSPSPSLPAPRRASNRQKLTLFRVVYHALPFANCVRSLEAKRYGNQMSSRVDELIFGRDLDFSTTPGDSTSSADDAKTKVKPPRRHVRSAVDWTRAHEKPQVRRAVKQMASEVDDIVFGRDMDFSATGGEEEASEKAAVPPAPEEAATRRKMTGGNRNHPLWPPQPAGADARDLQAKRANQTTASSYRRSTARQKDLHSSLPRTDTLICAEHASRMLAEKLRHQHLSIKNAFRTADKNHNGELDFEGAAASARSLLSPRVHT